MQTTFFHLHRISHICKFLSLPVTKTLVHSFISSRLDYCNSALSGLPDYDIQKLQCIQNAAAHLITRTRKYKHITPILIELHWLSVRQQILFNILVLTYCALHNSAPPCIQSWLTKKPHTRSLHSNSKLTLVVPLSYGKHAFSHFAPSQYNLLSEPLKLSSILYSLQVRT